MPVIGVECIGLTLLDHSGRCSTLQALNPILHTTTPHGIACVVGRGNECIQDVWVSFGGPSSQT